MALSPRLLPLATAGALTLTLAACGGDADETAPAPGGDAAEGTTGADRKART